MARKRKFDSHSEAKKRLFLLKMVVSALTEDDAMQAKWRTDYIGVACQYGSYLGIKRSDFDLIKGMSVEEIARSIHAEATAS